MHQDASLQVSSSRVTPWPSPVQQVRQISKLASKLDDEELVDEVEWLADMLNPMITHYEQVLRIHNIDLPYSGPLGTRD